MRCEPSSTKGAWALLRRPLTLLFGGISLLSLLACSEEESKTTDPPSIPSFTALPRADTDRTPRTAPCDDADPGRCLLPWPSNTFTRGDTSSATGLRLAVEATSLYSKEDDPSSLNLADGFSRVTPLATIFPGEIEDLPIAPEGKGSLRLILAQYDAADRGALIPLRYRVSKDTDANGDPESLLLAFPLQSLAAASDYVAVVLDDLPTTVPAVASRHTRLTLGLEAPANQEEADLQAYHAPTRAILTEAEIDPTHVLRVWNFTTRSEEDPQKRLKTMRNITTSAVSEGKVSAKIDKVEIRSDGPVAAVVEGHLTGVPLFVEASTGSALKLGSDGSPEVIGEHDAPFRVVIPIGAGDYQAVLFGHGTGGSFRDKDFDEDLAQEGFAKVSFSFYGWTEDDVIENFLGFSKMAIGSHHSSARLMQAIADGAAIEESLKKPIGDLLSTAQLGDEENPAAGRRPDFQIPLWVGGSMGGTMGALYTGSSPHAFSGVFNVGGAAWTHFIPGSVPFNMINAMLKAPLGGNLNVLAAMVLSQGTWDEIDGASWSSKLRQPGNTFLVQESIGDPVLPNPGTEMLSRVIGANMVGQPLVPIPGIQQADQVSNGSAVTQFKVPKTSDYDVHGFAAKNTPGGVAARQQIFDFLMSVRTGSPVIKAPISCPQTGCDFSQP